jgi:hypothetical protein
MPFYKYKYLKEGKEYEDTREFSDKGALYASVRSENGSIVSVKEVKSEKSPIKFFSFRKKIKTFSNFKLVVFDDIFFNNILDRYN